MESTYHRGSQERRARPRVKRTTGSYRKKSVALAPRERRRLMQLGVCLALFFAIFFGRGIFPERMETMRGELLQLIQTDTNFKAAFSDLGRSIQRGEPVLDTLGELWVDVFSGKSKVTSTYVSPRDHAPLYHEELAWLGVPPTADGLLERRFNLEMGDQTAQEPPVQEATPTPAPAATDEVSVLPTQPQPVVYDGPALPENATMDKVVLGLEQTVAPVMAVVSSPYGWREHPIEGVEKFHAGADLAAPYGDPVGAFADGVVDYIGESPAYGLYLQIRHDGGVTSFYAHCSKLCVQQGQRVTLGEKVAEVGDSGETTGAHLHFELKSNGELLNPLYYIDTLSS